MVGDLHAARARLRKGRHIGQMRRAPVSRDGDDPDLARPGIGHDGGQVGHEDRHLPRQQGLHGRGTALVGHVHHLDGAAGQEHLHGEVGAVAIAGGGIAQVAMRPGMGHQLPDTACGKRRQGHQRDRIARQHRYRRQRTLRVIGQLLEEERVHRRHRGIEDRKGMAVGGCGLQGLHGDHARAARAVVHHHDLPGLPRDGRRNLARDVVRGPACGIGHQDSQRLGWIGGGCSGRRARKADKGRAHGKPLAAVRW